MDTDDNPLLRLALRAVAEGWDEARARAEVTTALPDGLTWEVIESQIGPISDPTVALVVANRMDQFVEWLVPGDNDARSARLRGLMHLGLAMAWLMRAQIGGDRAAKVALRRHYEAARALLPADGNMGMALMMLGMMVEADGASPTFEDLPDSIRAALDVADEALNAPDQDAFLRAHLDVFTAPILQSLRGSAQMAARREATEAAERMDALLDRIVALQQESQAAEPAPSASTPAPARQDALGALPPWLRQRITETQGTPPGGAETERPWAGELAGRLVAAEDEGAFQALVAAWPEVYLPHVPNLLQRMQAMMESLADPGFDRAIQAQQVALDRLEQLQATQPLGAILWDFLRADDQAARFALADTLPALQSWEAVQMLADWAARVRERGEAAWATELEDRLNVLARRYHHTPLTQPTPAWVAQWLSYILDHRREHLQQVIATVEATHPEITPSFQAYDENDLDRLTVLSGSLEAQLWLTGRTTEALAVGLLVNDLGGLAGEAYDHYPPEYQQRLLEMGNEVCAEAADLCRYLEYPAGVAFYRGAQSTRLLLLRDLGAAEAAARESAQVWTTLAQADPAQHGRSWGRALTNLGHILSEQAQHHAAAAVYRQAEETLRAQYVAHADDPTTASDLGQVLLNQSAVLPQVGQTTTAIACVQEALALLLPLKRDQSSAYRETCAAAYMNLGVLLLAARRLTEAEAALEEAQRRFEALAQENSDRYQPELASLALNVTGLYMEQGYLDKANGTAAEAVARYRQLAQHLPRQHTPHLAEALDNQALVLADLKQKQAYRQAWDEALQVYRWLAQQEPLLYRPRLAQSLTNFGNRLVGDNELSQAESILREAQGLRERLVAEQPGIYEALLAATLVALGNVLRDTGRTAEATSLYQRAAGLDPTNRQEGRWRAWVGLARLERERGAWPLAYEWLVRAVQDLNSKRGELRGAADRRRFQRDVAGLYRELVDLCLELAKQDDRVHWHTQAWYWAEHGKGRTLLDLLDSERPSLASFESHPIYTRWKAQEQSIIDLESKLNDRPAPQGTDHPPARLGADKESQKSSWETIQDEIAHARSELDTLRRQVARLLETEQELSQVTLPDPARLARFVQGFAQGRGAAYRPDARPLLIDYFMLGQGRYVVFLLPLWLVEPGRPLPLLAGRVSKSADSTDRIVDWLFAGLIALYKQAQGTRGPAGSYTSAQTATDLEQLAGGGTATLDALPRLIGEVYLQPWAAKLQELEPTELILVPNAGMHLFPLHAALLADGTPLIERYPLVYLPNAALARTLAQRAKYSPRPAGRIILGPAQDDLPYSIRETGDLAEDWGLTDGAGLYRFAQMKLERLRERAGQLAVAHLSTHSEFDHGDYLQTSILFHQERLTLLRLLSDPGFDFTGMRLFYLNSCESGMVHPDVGDEMQGLVWTLLAAGAEAVMATLWPVNDQVAADMSIFFYQHWQPGVSLSSAYQCALHDLRQKHSHPAHWAPFVLHGNGF